MDKCAIEKLLAIAGSQHGLIALPQATALGVSQSAVEAAIAHGWLRRVRRGVYAVSGAPLTSWESVVAAALAAGRDAVVSHRSAATIHRFDGLIDDGPELTIPYERRLKLAGVRIHRSRQLAECDVEVRSGVRLTTPVRTVIDIAGTTGEFLLGRIVDDGTIRRLWTPDLIAARVEQLGGSGRAGRARLRGLLDYRRGEGQQDGRLEQRVLRAIKRAKGIPDPVVHHRALLGDRVLDMDLAWPEHRIDGEVDGYAAHSQWSDFQRDRLRANVLFAHDWHLVHWIASMDDDAIVAQVLPYFEAQ